MTRKGCPEIKGYLQAKNYLNGLVNYERDTHFSYRKALKLERMRRLLAGLQIPYRRIKAVHVAGTKGKGSAATFCAYLLAACGLKVGLYTSPHFFDFRERIKILEGRKGKIKSRTISKRAVVEAAKEIKPGIEKLSAAKKTARPTFFEVYTAVAFKYFIAKKVDFSVLETGLGGRLDATNVVSPLVCIITHIGYDHTDKLGNKLSAIAYEKAGIIKKKIPVVLSPQRKCVLGVIKTKCRNKKAPLFIFGRDFRAERAAINKKNTIFDFSSPNLKLKRLRIILKGRHQVENASLAIAAVALLKENNFLKEKAKFKEGLLCAFLRGRFEVIRRKPLTVADVAHNRSSFVALRDNLKQYFPSRKVILIFAASKGKDIKGMLKALKYSSLILTRFNNPRCLDPEEIRRKLPEKNVFIASGIKEAFRLAKRIYNKKKIIVVAGSLFLVSEAKKMIEDDQDNRTKEL